MKAMLIKITVTGGILASCSSSQNSSSLASAVDLSALNSSFSAYQQLASTHSFTDAVSAIGSANLSSFYNQALAASNNAPFRIGTHTFSHLKDYYSSMSDQVASNTQKFGHPAQLWSTIGFNSREEVSIAQYNDGLSVYERISQALDAGNTPVVSTDDAVLLAKVELVSLAETLAAKSTALALGDNDLVINNMSGGTINTGNNHYNNRNTTNNNCHSTDVGVVSQPQSGCGASNNNHQNNSNSASTSVGASVTNNGQVAATGAAGGVNGVGNGGGSGSGS